jgi:hypothetical protein
MPWLQCLFVAVLFEIFAACAAAQVDVAIATSKAVYVAGEPVFITARITNTSTAPLTIVLPEPDSCLSAISVAVEGLRRSDLPVCSDPNSAGCAYNGPPARLVEITPQTSYDMRRLVNLIYELDQPGEYRAHIAFSLLYTDQPVHLRGDFATAIAWCTQAMRRALKTWPRWNRDSKSQSFCLLSPLSEILDNLALKPTM